MVSIFPSKSVLTLKTNCPMRKRRRRPLIHFLDFLQNLARYEDGSIKLAIGYLSHRFHFADMR